jgi:hypothetical protein
MPVSVTIPIKLHVEELTKLDAMIASDVMDCEDRCEFFRLLLHREHNRRHNLGKPKPELWQTAFRVGRPRK